MKVCRELVSLEVFCVDVECFYALLWRCTWLLNCFFFCYFWAFLTVFGPFRSQRRVKMAWSRAKHGYRKGQKMDENLVILGWFCTIFGSIPGQVGVTQGSFGIVLASFWGCFGIVLASFSGRFGAFLTLLGGFSAFLGRKKTRHFGECGSKNVLKP